MRFFLWVILLVASLLSWAGFSPVYAAPIPDLAVVSATLEPGQLKFKIKNLNLIDVQLSPGQRLAVKLEWLTEGGEVVGTVKNLYLEDSMLDSLDRSHAPSQSLIISSFYGEGSYWFSQIRSWLHDADASPSQGTRLRITVDADNIFVPEDNERNNVFEVRRPMVDLYPTTPDFTNDRLIFKIRASPSREFFATNGFAVRFAWLDADANPIPDAFYDWQTTTILEYLNDRYEVRLLNNGTFLFDTDRTTWEYTTQTGSRYSVGAYQRYFDMASAKQFLTTNIPDTARALRITLDQNVRIAEAVKKNNAVDVARPLPDLRVLEGRFYETSEGFVKKVLEFKPINIGNNPVSYPDDHRMTVSLTWMAGDTPFGIPYSFDAVPAQHIARRPSDIVGYWIFDSRYFRDAETWLNEPPPQATHLRVQLDADKIVVEQREDNNIALYNIPGVVRATSTPAPRATQTITNPSSTPTSTPTPTVTPTPTPTQKVRFKYIPINEKKTVKGATMQVLWQNSFFDQIIGWLKNLFQIPVQSPPPISTSPAESIIEAFRTKRFDELGVILANPVSYAMYATECCGPLTQAEVLSYVQKFAAANGRTFTFDQKNSTITRIAKTLKDDNQFIVLASDNAMLVFQFTSDNRIAHVTQYSDYHVITGP